MFTYDCLAGTPAEKAEVVRFAAPGLIRDRARTKVHGFGWGEDQLEAWFGRHGYGGGCCR